MVGLPWTFFCLVSSPLPLSVLVLPSMRQRAGFPIALSRRVVRFVFLHLPLLRCASSCFPLGRCGGLALGFPMIAYCFPFSFVSPPFLFFLLGWFGVRAMPSLRLSPPPSPLLYSLYASVRGGLFPIFPCRRPSPHGLSWLFVCLVVFWCRAPSGSV